MSTANIDIFVQKHGSDQALQDVEKGLAATQARANTLGSEVDKAGVAIKDMADQAKALGVSLKSELEAKLRPAESSLQAFREQGQRTSEQERELQDTTRDLKGELAGLTKETDSAEKGQQSLVAQIAAGVIAAGLFQRAGRAVVDFMRDSIGEAAKYEQAQRNLNVAFELSGRAISGMPVRLEAYADQLEALGLAEDDEILRVQALLMRMTDLDEQGLKAATRGALGLAYVFDMDLQTAAEAVARGMAGNYRALGQLIPAIKNAKTEEEKHAILLRELETAYQQAVAGTETFIGQTKKLDIEWKNIKQTFGEAILGTGILQGAMKGATSLLELLTGQTAAFKDRARECIAEIKDFSGTLNVLRPSQEEMWRALQKGSAAWEEFKAKTKATDDLLNKNRDTIVNWIYTAAEFIGITKGAGKATEDLTWIFEKFGLKTKATLTKELGDAEEALRKLRGSAEATPGQIEALGKKIKDLRTQITGTIKPVEYSATKIRALADAKNRAKEATEKLLKPGNELIAQQKTMAEQLERLGKLELDHSEDKLPRMTECTEELKTGFEDAAEVVRMFADYSNKLVLEQAKGAKAVSNAWAEACLDLSRDIAGAITSVSSGTQDASEAVLDIVHGMTASFGQAIGDMISQSLAAFGAFAGPIGSLFGGMIGGMLGALVDAFSGTEEAAGSLAEHIIADFESLGDVSQATADAIIADAQRINDSWRQREPGPRSYEGPIGFGGAISLATIENLNRLISDTGINILNITEYWGMAGEALQQYINGGLSAGETTVLLDEAFESLARAAQELGQEGSADMVRFIQSVRDSGLEIPSVTEYVQAQLETIPDSLSSMIAAIDTSSEAVGGLTDGLIGLPFDEVSDDLERVGALAIASFNSMLASGVPWSDAVRQMQEPLEALKAKYAELGKSADPALQQLFEITGVTAANQELFDAIDANNQVLQALGNSGWLTAESLQAVSDNALDYYAELQAAGLSADDALRAMGPTLQEIHDQAETYGLAVDSNTQSLLDQAEALGIINDNPPDPGTVMEEGLNRVAVILEAIAIALGAEIPEAAEGAADTINRAMGGAALGITDEMGDGAKTITDDMAKAADTTSEKWGLALIGISDGADTVKDRAIVTGDKWTDAANRLSLAWGEALGGIVDETQLIVDGAYDAEDAWVNAAAAASSAWQGLSDMTPGSGGGGGGAAAGSGRGLPAYGVGGIAWSPQIAHLAELEPEVVIPMSDYRAGRGLAAGAGSGRASAPVIMSPNITIHQTIYAARLDRDVINESAEQLAEAVREQWDRRG